MRAFEMAEPRAQDMMDLALKRGLLILNAGPSTIRFVPPLIIQQAEIDEAIDQLDASLRRSGCRCEAVSISSPFVA